MPSLTGFPAFVAASLGLLVVPGPAVLLIVSRSGAHGRRTGLVSVLGVHTASLVHVLAAAAGLSALVVASSRAFGSVRLLGGAYLIWLGAVSLRSAHRLVEPVASGSRPGRRVFAEAFVVNLLNPKVAVFFLAFLPQFVHRDRGPLWRETALLGLAYVALGLCTDGLYAVVAARAGAWLRGRSAGLRALRRAEGALLIGLGLLALAVPHRRPATT